MIAGGAQDNGTLATLDARADTYFEMTGGDGGWVIIDPEDERHLFTTVQGMKIFRFRSRDGWKQVSPPAWSFQMWMVFLSRLYAMTRGWRRRIDAMGRVCHGAPQRSRSRSR
jgi:hypothetical protein